VQSYAAAPDVVVVEPLGRGVGYAVRELWQSRELIGFLALRNVRVRYKQSVIRIGWAVIQPFFTMIVFSVLFARVGGLTTNGIPAPVFYYAGLVPWYLFATTVALAASSLVGNASMLQKVYFPRLVLPLAALGSTLVDFVIAFSVLLGMMVFYGAYGNCLAVLALPLLLLLAITVALGTGLIAAALNVRYRDVQYAMPFILQVWLLATVAIPASAFSEPWRTVYGLNPMAGVVEGFRWALLGQQSSLGGTTIASAVVAILLLAGGFLYFRRTERTVVDVI